MERKALLKVLDEAPVLTKLPNAEAEQHLNNLLKSPGLPLLWGLMLGAKQAQYAALGEAPTSNMEQVRRVGVIQGTIRGIDMLYQTLLEQSVPSRTEETEEQK